MSSPLRSPLTGKASLRVDFLNLVRRQSLHRIEGDLSADRLPLVHLNAPELDTSLHGIPTMNPGQIVDIRKRVADADAHAVVILGAQPGSGYLI